VINAFVIFDFLSICFLLIYIILIRFKFISYLINSAEGKAKRLVVKTHTRINAD
jgi:hypothetical protein